MSYSFRIVAPSKEAAKVAIADKFADVIRNQACHERDKVQALAAAGAFIDLLVDGEDRDVAVSMSGSLAGQWSGSDVTKITGANISIGAGFVPRGSI